MSQLPQILMILVCSMHMFGAEPATQPTTRPVEAGRVTLYVAIVKPGETWLANKAAGKPNDLSAHFAYVKRMREEGKLILGGPFADGAGGLLVYRADSMEEARKLMSADPACVQKIFEFEMHPWLLNEADLPR
jgi:uncharacterized protein YciI